jgi:4-cresol dehydrogenase (hydroxylating)
VVEPGVRWFDLYEAVVQSAGHPLMLSIADLGWGMVAGAGLDCIAGLLPVSARSFIHITMVIFDTQY